MKGDEKKLGKVLSGKKQFIIPAYQRSYSWNDEQWSEIWRPIEDIASAMHLGKVTHPYFIGSVVVHLHDGSEIEQYDVIDGQQRLTTLTTLLGALRDIAVEKGEEEIREEVDESYLRNKFVKEEHKLKVLSQENDASDMRNIVFNNENGKGKVWLAYKYFLNVIRELVDSGKASLKDIMRTVGDGMMVVEIITEEGDNPHRIFQTLNSTGLSLGEVDKLRSHFFMLLPNQHEKHHLELWKPMEKLLGANIDRFLLVDLVSQAGGLETTKKEHVYKRWQERLRTKEYSEAAILDELKGLNGRATIFHNMLSPTGAGIVDSQVRRLNEWGSSTHHTIAFRILTELDQGQIDEEEAVECLKVVESYMVRRMLVGTPTNNLNRLFTSVLSQINSRSGRLLPALISSLSEPRKEWPTDQELETVGANNSFYKTQNPEQRQFVLRRLEESLAVDGHVDWRSAKFSIEHFMPQTLNESWSEVIRSQGFEEVHDAHADVVHQIGNLTLTSLNSKLSNFPKERKQQILKDSPLRLTSELKGADVWGPREILARSAQLMQMAMSIWVAPEQGEDSESVEFSVVERALQELSGAEWTSVGELASMDESFDDDLLIEYMNETSGEGAKRVLTSEGIPDLRFSWVEENPRKYYDHLLSLGVLSSLEEKKADETSLVKTSELLQRLGEAN